MCAPAPRMPAGAARRRAPRPAARPATRTRQWPAAHQADDVRARPGRAAPQPRRPGRRRRTPRSRRRRRPRPPRRTVRWCPPRRRRPPGATGRGRGPSPARAPARILGSTRSRNFWPPKPGSTVISSSMSSSGSRSAYGSTAVAGRSAIPARTPAARSVRASRTGACVASTWKVTLRAPGSAYAGAQRSASSIIRCTSSGSAETVASRSTTGSPIVRLGTKWLSMTSTCTQSAPVDPRRPPPPGR